MVPLQISKNKNIMAPTALIAQIRTEMRRRHYSYKTEQAYIRWIDEFFRFTGLAQLNRINRREVRRFLDHLIQERGVRTTQYREAISAIHFLYRTFL